MQVLARFAAYKFTRPKMNGNAWKRQRLVTLKGTNKQVAQL